MRQIGLWIPLADSRCTSQPEHSITNVKYTGVVLFADGWKATDQCDNENKSLNQYKYDETLLIFIKHW